jgi:hypothetical protein
MIVQTGPNPEILSQINRILSQNDIKPKDTVSIRNDIKDEPLQNGTDDDIKSQKSDEECDENDTDCIVEQEVEKFKPKPISFLTLPDDKFEQKVIQKSKTKSVIYGTGFKCICGANIKNKRHIKDHEKTIKHQFFILKNETRW